MNRVLITSMLLFTIFYFSCKECKLKPNQSSVQVPDSAITLFLNDTFLTAHHYDLRGKAIREINRSGKPIKIRKKIDCAGTKFFDMADFSYITFDSGADFTNAHFYYKTCFSSDSFKSYMNFSGTVFDSITNFSSSIFDTTVNFTKARFHRTTRFDGITLREHAKFNFINAGLPSTLDFSFTSVIPGKIDLSVAFFGSPNIYDHIPNECIQPTLLLLIKSDVSKFDVDYKNFKLDFNGSAINPFKTRAETDTICSECARSGNCSTDIWDAISNDEKTSIYEALLNNFKSKGQAESYVLLDEEYRDFQWSTLPWYFCWLKIFPKYWNDYGHEKGRVFFWAAIFFCFFWFINFHHLAYLNGTIYSIKKELESFEKNRDWYSFLYTGAIFFGLTLKVEKINFKFRTGSIYIIIVYTVGIICLAYMANFILQK